LTTDPILADYIVEFDGQRMVGRIGSIEPAGQGPLGSQTAQRVPAMSHKGYNEPEPQMVRQRTPLCGPETKSGRDWGLRAVTVCVADRVSGWRSQRNSPCCWGAGKLSLNY
jgi:hypothetical protein